MSWNSKPSKTAVRSQAEAVFPSSEAMEQNSLQPKKLKNASVTILNEILKAKAKLDEDLVKENNAILKSFLETFIPEMKKHDKIFESIYQKIYFTGSFYSDLRVSVPDEYDLNLQLKLPFKAKNISVEYQPQVPSYVKYKISDESIITRENGLNKLFENGYLIPDKVRLWIQSVVDKALKTYQCPRNVARVKCSASGPARTIILIKKDGSVIDIDLVPAIECSMNLKPPGIDEGVYARVSGNLQCFLVPKPYQPSKQAPVNNAERARLWRTHYPEAERTVIHDLGCVKPLIKLLKLLRDKENWKILASYYLKTVVMWMIIQNSNKESWRMDHLGEKFVEALGNLQSFVERRQIRYFFSSKYNLLEKLSAEQSSNIQNRLRIIIRDIERDIEKLWDVFGCPRTFQIWNKKPQLKSCFSDQ